MSRRIRIEPASPRIARRGAIAIGVVLSTVVSFAFPIGGAWASVCTNADHCYSEEHSSSTPLYGYRVAIDPSYLTSSTYQMINPESWIVDGQGNWVEAGFMSHGSGVAIAGGGLPSGATIFWGEKRPGSQFQVHLIQANPTEENTVFWVTRQDSTTWRVRAQNTQFDIPAYSTGNTMPGAEYQLGLEYSDETTGGAKATWSEIGYYQSYAHTLISGEATPRSHGSGPGDCFSWVSTYTKFTDGMGAGC